MTAFDMPISESIWDMKYRFKTNTGDPIDVTVEDTWRRIAKALAAAEEPELQEEIEAAFYEALEDWKYIPAGRIVAGAGTERMVTLFNCFVMGTIPDSMDGIFSMLKEAALTMQQGGGIGYDFSPIRPKGALVKKLGADASGPLTFMDCWDSMCRTVMSAGSRRGAMMATMRCDHPDIMDFITAKGDPNRLRMFNLSVLCSDRFMNAVKSDGSIALWHPEPPNTKEKPRRMKPRRGETESPGYIYDRVKARDIWQAIMENTYAQAEPGVIFIDRINEANNLNYVETIAATNPCGEQPLPPYGACLLGSINLARLVENAFTDQAGIDQHELSKLVFVAVRMMDNVVDVSNFPLEAQRDEAKAKRRIGLGVTGLADALVMCGLTYGSEEAAERTEKWLSLIDIAAYKASTMLAREKGAFPLFDVQGVLAPGTHASTAMPAGVQMDIQKHGLRNALLTSIAPTGTISLYAGNVSSGIEPIFAYGYNRKVLLPDGTHMEERVEDFAVAAYRKHWEENIVEFITTPEGKSVPLDSFDPDEHLPDYFVTAQTLTPADHVRMQAAAQKWIDSSISKTVNLPEDISMEAFEAVYLDAYEKGCKGCTTYRPNEITGSVISVDEKPKEEPLEKLTDSEAEAEELARIVDPEPKPLPPEVVEALENATDGLLERPEELEGTTYRIRVGGQKSVYLTVNDMVMKDGSLRPFEIFLRSSDPTHDEWMQAMSRMISAILRRPHDASFVPRQLMRIHSAVTGGFIQGGQGRAPSLVAAIGQKLQEHMKQSEMTIFSPELSDEVDDMRIEPELSEWPDFAEHPIISEHVTGIVRPEDAVQSINAMQNTQTCLSCGSTNIKHESGCESCLDCGESKCG